MKTLLIVFLAALCVSAIPKDGNRKYIGSQMFRAHPKTESQVRYLIGLYNSGKYDFWTTPRAIGSSVDILVSRWLIHPLREALKLSKIEYDVIIPDMYKAIKIDLIENEFARGRFLESGKAGAGAMDWTSYHTYDEINDWVDSLATTYPDLVTVEDVGKSFEGRTMKIVKVSTGGAGKPAIFSDAGIHAREWIASATLTYIMNELLSNSAAYQDVLDTVDFYFMANINPDGYSWTMADGGDRLWRKTRSPTDSTLGCIGADANRNWDFHWMESGSSQNPCTDTYAGPKPFSEIEAVNVRDQILKYADNTQVYLTFHSYGQVMIYPWGYDTSLPPDWEDLDALARSSTAALTAVHGTKYQTGSSGQLLYPASGASDDYSKGVGGIKYAYTVELRPTGNPGFELPPNQITPTGEETFALFENVMDFVRDTYGKK